MRIKYKTWLRSQMGQEKLDGLALLHVHGNINRMIFETTKVIIKFLIILFQDLNFPKMYSHGYIYFFLFFNIILYKYT